MGFAPWGVDGRLFRRLHATVSFLLSCFLSLSNLNWGQKFMQIQTCPYCRADMIPRDGICVQCGRSIYVMPPPIIPTSYHSKIAPPQTHNPQTHNPQKHNPGTATPRVPAPIPPSPPSSDPMQNLNPGGIVGAVLGMGVSFGLTFLIRDGLAVEKRMMFLLPMAIGGGYLGNFLWSEIFR